MHPAAVHFPIAFLALSFGLDILHQLQITNRLPSSISKGLPLSPDMTRMSYFLLSAGLITAIPAIVTGGREAIVLLSKQGMKDTDGTVRPKVKAMFAHAIFNDVVIAVSTYIWYQKRANAAHSVAGKVGIPVGAAAYQPENWMVYTEAPIMLLMFMAANIGGVLAYNFGIGFSAGGGSGAKKTQ